MTTVQKRWLSLGAVVFFCLLCLGTSAPSGPPISTGAGMGGGPLVMNSAPKSIPHSAPEKGRIDPFDPKLPSGDSHYDAFVLHLAPHREYRITVRPGDPPDAGAPRGGTTDAGPDASVDSPDASVSSTDAGGPELWFSVQVMKGNTIAGAPLAVRETVHDSGHTEARFKTMVGGPHTVAVTAFFGTGPDQKPGFSTYVFEVRPVGR